jgi:hypothetical protein
MTATSVNDEELSFAYLGQVTEQTWVGWRLAQDAAQLGDRHPRIAILYMGKDVRDRAAIYGER